MQVFIYGLHHSRKYWDAPEEFRPERWLVPEPTAGEKPSFPGTTPCALPAPHSEQLAPCGTC